VAIESVSVDAADSFHALVQTPFVDDNKREFCEGMQTGENAPTFRFEWQIPVDIRWPQVMLYLPMRILPFGDVK
jgi:hypothetical protein